MRILLVGANGTIGQAVARELSARHEIVTAGRSGGDIRLDLADPASHGPALAKAGKLDAVVSTAGNVHFGALAEMTEELWGIGLRDKLMGQVQFALAASKVLVDGGSITLTSTTATSVAGTASNLVLREVSIGTGAIVGTCATTIASVDFTAN